MSSFKKPTSQQIETAIQRLRSPEFAAYFFSRLENPQWVEPLKERGLFTSPPPPTQVEGGGVMFPHWPASQYLARMAKYAPTEVASIFANLETDNISVVGDMISASLAMPANEATRLVPPVSRAAQSGMLWIHFKDASDLCALLAYAGEASGAMTLAEALFRPGLEEGKRQPSRHDDYWYRKCLQKVLPLLVELKPHEFLVKLCTWLDAAVCQLQRADADSGSDYSYIWRPAIEDHEQNKDFELAATIVGLVRQAFEQALREGKVTLQEALSIIAEYSYLVFARIRIHLINEFAEQDNELTREVIMDRTLFDDFRFKHEYAMLVGNRLDILKDEQLNEWFGWVDAGPDMSGFDERVRQARGRDATDEDRRDRIRYWQFEKLHCVRNHLEGDRQSFYKHMLVSHGEPELADLSFRMGSDRWGNESPMSVEELAKLTFEQAVERVASWKPDEHEFMGPTVEGLASTFDQYVATDTEAFSAKAAALIGRPTIFVRRYLDRISDAIQSDGDVDVLSVVHLCGSVLKGSTEQPHSCSGKIAEASDNDLQSTYDAISGCLRRICESRVNGVPKYTLEPFRDAIWGILEKLSRGPAASYVLRDVSQDDPRTHDYLDLGINSHRGRALEAALSYAGWVAKHLAVTAGAETAVPGGFDVMPEVREVLEWQMDTSNRSVEALAVIGSRIGLIYWIDKNWLGKNVGRLFFLEGIEKSPPVGDGWSAWNAFLVWNNPRVEYYKLFKEQFAYGVQQSAQVATLENARAQPMFALGEHLMILYGRGEIGIDDEDGLLRRFLFDTNPDIRRHAIGFVGQSIQGSERIPEDVLRRFQELWELYWEGAGQRDVEEKPDSWLFGTWFSSGQFPDQWALEQLGRFVDFSPTPEPDHAIVERLAQIAQADIARAIRILDRMVRGDREGWRIHMWVEPARRILELAMVAHGEARTQAERIIDYLGRRGYVEFGDLLNPQGVTGPL